MDELEEDEIFWKEHGRAHTAEEMEWYRLWFDFLKLSDRRKWSDFVADCFGDVSCEFEEWWPDHSYLFRQLKHFLIEEIVTDQDFQLYKDDGTNAEMPEVAVIILAVHMAEPKAALRSAFEQILLKYHKGKPGRPKFDDWGDVLTLTSRPDTDMLKKILAVYRVHKKDQEKPAKERLKHWQIEELVSQTTPLIVKSGDFAEYIWKTPDVDAHIIERRRKSQHATVKKYLNYADEILKNVVVGKFPVYTVDS